MEIFFIIPEIDNKNNFILFHTSNKASPSLPTISYILATDPHLASPTLIPLITGRPGEKGQSFPCCIHSHSSFRQWDAVFFPPRERLPLGPRFSGALRGCSSVLHLMYLHPKPLGFFHHHPIYDFFYHSF